jgi:hypothetical protein
MAKKKTIEVLEDAVTATQVDDRPRKHLSLGCPLLNLAVSGDYKKGLIAGTYMFYVGDSQSGKTLATLTQLAEAANNPDFDDYELWHINAEVGSFFDFELFFGPKAASRIQVMNPPPGKAMLLESVYDFIEAKIAAGIKIIAVIDSMDALSTEQLEKHIKECAKAREQGKDSPGSYGDGKAKINSERLKRIISMIWDSGSILTSISQIRDNVGGGLYEPKKIRSGGHAIKFGGSVEIWTTPGQKMTKDINGKPRVIGMKPVFNIKKNRVNGRERMVSIPIIPDVGMDAVGAAVDFLIDEKEWTVSGGRVVSTMYEKSYYREELIRMIENDNREDELYQVMQDAWNTIEEQLTITRKNRYQ